jgi:hypothetical protein
LSSWYYLLMKKSREYVRRSRAARLGWERRREIFERRSKAARLGWRHRRVREATEFKRRSDASKKGWETRRAAGEVVPVERGGGPEVLFLGDSDLTTGGDWYHVKESIPFAGTENKRVVIDTPFYEYDGLASEFPYSEFYDAAQNYFAGLHKSLDTPDTKSYWRISDLFSVQNWYPPDNKDNFDVTRVGMLDGWEQTIAALADQVSEVGKK